MFIFFDKLYKQIIHVSSSLLLSAFPSCSLSLIQITAKHGLTFVFCKGEIVFVFILSTRVEAGTASFSQKKS